MAYEAQGTALGSPRMIWIYVFKRFGGMRLRFQQIKGPSDALARRLCSEIVQGRVRVDSFFAAFWGFRIWRGTIQGGVQYIRQSTLDISTLYSIPRK